jgi:hypothetical protein
VLHTRVLGFKQSLTLLLLSFVVVDVSRCLLVNSVWPLLIKEDVSVFGLRVGKQPSLSTSFRVVPCVKEQWL